MDVNSFVVDDFYILLLQVDSQRYSILKMGLWYFESKIFYMTSLYIIHFYPKIKPIVLYHYSTTLGSSHP